MLKHIKISLLLLLLFVPLLMLGIFKNHKQMQVHSRGNYFFENTKNNNDLAKILIQRDDNVVTLVNKDNLWRVEEANYYYANFAKINALINKLYNTTVYRADIMKDSYKTIFDDETKIYTYDSKGNVIDEVSIAPRDEKNKYHYAKLNNNNLLYQITENLFLSSLFMDWVQTPLVSFTFNEVKSIKYGDYIAYRRFSNEELKSITDNKENPYLRGFISNLWNLTAEKILYKSEFDKDKYKKIMSFAVTTFDNVIFNFDIYSDQKEFFISINPVADMLITHFAQKQLNESLVLYDGWFFKINSDIGTSITKFVF